MVVVFFKELPDDMQSDRDAPIYRIPKAAGAGTDVKKAVDSYMEFHNDSKGDNLAARTEGYTEVGS